MICFKPKRLRTELVDNRNWYVPKWSRTEMVAYRNGRVPKWSRIEMVAYRNGSVYRRNYKATRLRSYVLRASMREVDVERQFII